MASTSLGVEIQKLCGTDIPYRRGHEALSLQETPILLAPSLNTTFHPMRPGLVPLGGVPLQFHHYIFTLLVSYESLGIESVDMSVIFSVL